MVSPGISRGIIRLRKDREGANRAEVIGGDVVIEEEEDRVRLRPLLGRPRHSSQYRLMIHGLVRDRLVSMPLPVRMPRHPT